MQAALTKGVALLSTREFCLERFGSTAWQRVCDALPKEDVETLDQVDEKDWFALAIFDRLNDAIDQVLGTRDLRTMVDLGYYAADRDMTTTMRLFLRIASPHLVLKMNAGLWSRFQRTGTWTIVKETPTRARARLKGWGIRSEATCVRVSAHIERLLQLVGGTNARVTRTECCLRGDPVCEYLCEWQDT